MIKNKKKTIEFYKLSHVERHNIHETLILVIKHQHLKQPPFPHQKNKINKSITLPYLALLEIIYPHETTESWLYWGLCPGCFFHFFVLSSLFLLSFFLNYFYLREYPIPLIQITLLLICILISFFFSFLFFSFLFFPPFCSYICIYKELYIWHFICQENEYQILEF